MTMRLEAAFARPLTREQRTSFLLVVSALAKTQRIRFVRGDQGAMVSGEALSARHLRQVLEAEGIAVEWVRTSLDEAQLATVEDGPEGAGKERVRPIGR
ncbi:MAG: hypothetical protein H0W83_10330 [Planctomycetes bacterium]|nr:hypothetical protein [Planctomycetota bacterium]